MEEIFKLKKPISEIFSNSRVIPYYITEESDLEYVEIISNSKVHTCERCFINFTSNKKLLKHYQIDHLL